MKPKIFFDSRWIGNHGIGRVAKELRMRMKVQDLDVCGRPTSPLDMIFLLISILRNTKKNDLIFSPGFNFPIFFIRKYIFFVHDLNHIDIPENSNFLKKFYYNFFLKRAILNAAHIFTISEFSRKRIIDWSGVDKLKVSCVGCGVETRFFEDPVDVDTKYAFKYALCVGNRKAHKNQKRVIESFCNSKSYPDLKLVFSGTESNELIKSIKKYDHLNKIVFAGNLTDEELINIYKKASMLIFPSIYEGFGLPIVEAMACGVPVITSNTTACVETAGDAAFLVNPLSLRDITDAIDEVYFNKELRNSMVKKGISRARLYNWDNVYIKTINEIKKL